MVFHALREDDGWCDAPDDPAYNRPVRLPYPASAENLFRDSHVYDVILVLGYNDSPPESGLGSAIFLHVAREGYKPTEGCVAISAEHMLELLPKLKPGCVVDIVN
jgi:L,D-peptidoglycan transpeptidase YkuD (ErfK/YbiS/YcfS/YnhG family)